MNRDNFLTVTGTDYIRAMYANTRDGILTFEEDDGDVQIPLDWDEEMMEEIVSIYEELVGDLISLAENHSRWEHSLEGMPMNLLDTWLTFLEPYPEHGMDDEKLCDIFVKMEVDEPLTQEEEDLRSQWVDWLRENALTRLPYNRCNPANFIQRARRYEKLLALHAPGLVLNNESRCLAEELVQYYCLTVEE